MVLSLHIFLLLYLFIFPDFLGKINKYNIIFPDFLGKIILYIIMIKFSDFIKKYTSIPNQFVDDFFSILDDYQNYDNFFINLDKISEWLNIRKDNIKKILVDNFSKNIDYELTNKKIIK